MIRPMCIEYVDFVYLHICDGLIVSYLKIFLVDPIFLIVR